MGATAMGMVLVREASGRTALEEGHAVNGHGHGKTQAGARGPADEHRL